MWSPYYRKFIRDSGLKNGRSGFGVQPTWPVDAPIFSIPLDHCLVSPEIKVIDVSVEEAKLLLMGKLYETGKLSLGQAAELAGYSRPTFMELLGKMEIPVFDYPAEDLEREMNL
ncbi:MAG: UPF0175 family protein [Hormoscilla sp. GM102CHS1]|nr:UPF0175 family protein [Hormoscilla sp. GM102CHS1]